MPVWVHSVNINYPLQIHGTVGTTYQNKADQNANI